MPHRPIYGSSLPVRRLFRSGPSRTRQSGAPSDSHTPNSLKAHLAELTLFSSAIICFAPSHYHYAHTANANDFAGIIWLVRQVKRNAMFAKKPPIYGMPADRMALII